MGSQTKEKDMLHYILKFAGSSKGAYIRSIILALIGVVFSLIPYVLMGDIVQKLISGEKEFRVYLVYALIMAGCWILRILFHTASTVTSHKATFGVIGNVRLALCDKLAALPLGTVQSIPSGAMKNIVVERTDSMEPTLAHVVPEFTANIAAPIFFFIYILTIDWRMALLSLATIPVAVICMMLMFRNYEAPFKRTQDSTKSLNDAAVEYIGGIEVIKAFGKAESSYQRFVDAAQENAASFVDWMRQTLGPFAVAMTFAPATLLTVLPIGAVFVMNGSLPLTDYVMILILAIGLITPIVTVMGYNDDIGKVTSIFGDIDDVLELKELSRPDVSEKIPEKFDIELSDVHFGYLHDQSGADAGDHMEQAEREVLHGIDLTIPGGTITALVGPSGSGKSTIARLIASLWDTDEGSISIGGVDIKSMALSDYNKMVAYVSQDNFLFDTTVRENIRMGRMDATDEEVEEIARQSGCYDFIMNLENGFDTIVGGSGAHLSGGERQRIAIARAMMKNAPILILDEATAYTDPENEAVIQQAVARLAKGRTMIVIAHRLSTITDSDQIVVIKEGRIEAKGRHEELISSCKLYEGMWKAHISAKDTEGGAAA